MNIDDSDHNSNDRDIMLHSIHHRPLKEVETKVNEYEAA